jgi:ABC-type sugar transport system ATPase subunit
MAELEVRLLRKEFGALRAVDDVSVRFDSARVTCLLGPSGCGKTTLMRMIAGLEAPTSGDVLFDGRSVTRLSASARDIGMVFQYPVVYQGMSVRNNVALPLRSMRQVAAAERERRVRDALDILDLGEVADVDVGRLSHALKQKVAVARAIARQPHIILLDEPVTNIDASTKSQLKHALRRLTRELHQTIVYVTHDQTEAMTLADEILLMHQGRVVQRGEPREVYNHPADRFGGWFLGNPGMNFVPQRPRMHGGATELERPLFGEPVALRGLEATGDIVVGIRPERIVIDARPSAASVPATVFHAAIVTGGQQLLALDADGVRLKAKVAAGSDYRIGDTVHMACPLDHVTLFDADGNRLPVVLERRTPLRARGLDG